MFVAERFRRYLTGSVLNIGGRDGEKHVLRLINHREYLELDIVGKSGSRIDLDSPYPWPFEDRKFDEVSGVVMLIPVGIAAGLRTDVCSRRNA